MAGIIGALIVVFSIGATAAALMQPFSSILQAIVKYLRGIYGTQPTSTDSDNR